MRFISTIFFLFASLCFAYAVKAYPYPVEMVQPDGTVIQVVIHGDEFFRYTTTVSGELISKGLDGYYHYADYSSGSLILSPTRVGSGVLPFIHSAISEEMSMMFRMRNYDRYLKSMAGAEVLSDTKGGDSPIEKDVKVLVLLVQFQDVQFSILSPKEHFTGMLNTEGYSDNGATGSARDYFTDNFTGFSFTFDVSDVITLGHNEDYYGANDESIPNLITYDKRMNLLIHDACEAINDKVDFSIYDRNNDGIVDYLFVYFAGYNEAECGEKNTIWPHTWNIQSYKYSFDGVRIGLYGCSSELMGSTNAIPAGIGTFCHEFSHSMGLKDLYDVNYGSSGVSKCLWKTLSVMDEGNYNNDGRTPPYYCAIDRELAGIANIQDFQPGKRYTMGPSYLNGVIFKKETAVSGEYYLFENRVQTGWDSYIGGSGMLVYHVDKSDNVAGGIKAVVRWDNNLINASASHECADLVEALDDAVSVSQVFFPGQGGVEELSASSLPALEDWMGNPVGLKLFNIKQSGDDVIFETAEDNTERLLPVLTPSVTVYQREALIKWNTEKKGSFTWGIIFSDKIDTTTDMNYTFEKLLPKTEYECGIFYQGKEENGDTVAVKFTTMELTSSYPYIFHIKNKYAVGDTIVLKTLNIMEDISNQEWFVDGTLITDERYIPDTPGKKTVKSVITYSKDGSKETLTKIIAVNEKEQ